MQCKVCGQDNPPEAHFCANCGATLEAAVELPSPGATTAAAHMGFWIRFGAAIIDGIVISLISSVISYFLVGIPYSPVLFIVWLPLLWLYYWLFTGLRGQTPGKMAVGIKVVDAQGDRPGLGGAALREVLGKLISTIVLYVGFLWIAWDKQKQGWHDRIAGTHVIKVVKAKSKE